jgi:hypothetical protein
MATLPNLDRRPRTYPPIWRKSHRAAAADRAARIRVICA